MTRSVSVPSRSIVTLWVLGLTAALLVGLVPSTADAVTASESDAEQRFVELVNGERAERGLRKVKVSSELTRVARDHTADMVRTDDLHHNPDLGDDVTNWRRLAENVGYSSVSVASLHRAFMNSAGHRANILDDRVTQVGVGVRIHDDIIWVTKVFRLPEDAGSEIEVQDEPVTLDEFRDVLAGSAHAESILAVTDAAIAEGCAEQRFCPARGVTRATMAAFLARALDLDDGPDDAFDDVSGPHAGAIGALTEAGLTEGCGDDRFCPDRKLSRAQLASFLAGALELDTDGEPDLVDLAPDSVHAGAVAALVDEGITSGCGDDRFCPAETLSRAATASFLTNAFGL